MYDGQPDNDQVMQDETTLPAVPVRIEGNVRTQALPARSGAYSTHQLGVTGATTRSVAERILTADPRRQAAYVLSYDQDIYAGASQSEAGIAGGLWPAGVPMPVGHTDEVWVAAATDTTRVTVIIEQWAM